MNVKSSIPAVEIKTVPWSGALPDVSCAAQQQLNAHDAAWISAVSKGLKQDAYLIVAASRHETIGVLPLCLVAGPVFGRFLVSLPYVNTGGAWARDTSTIQRLITAACDLADELDVKYLELRHENAVVHQKLTFTRTEKVHMRLQLPESSERLLASFKSKVRSQVKKSTSSGLSVEFGRNDLLRDFYRVFAHNMRDLGTPVFSKNLFANILQEFGSNAELCIVRSGIRPAAAALLVHNRNITEIPSASCIRSFNPMNANMFMYWHLLQRAIEKGSHTFDFGRSSLGSGPQRFKSQWGAQPEPAVWQYYVREGDPAEMRADSSSKHKLVHIWQKLPVWLTRLVGPSIIRGIP